MQFFLFSISLLIFASLNSEESSTTEISPEYDLKCQSIDDFHENLASAKIEDKYGFINSTGDIIIPFEYDSVNYFSNGYVGVCKNGKWGIINKHNQLVISYKYDFAFAYYHTLFLVVQKGKINYITRDENDFINFEYDEVDWFRSNYAKIRINGKYGYIDTLGNLVVPAKYIRAYDAQHGWIWAIDADSNDVYIHIPLDQNFNDLGHVGLKEGDYMYIREEDKVGVLHRSGKFIAPIEFREIFQFSEGYATAYKVRNDSLFKYYLDTLGNLVDVTRYDRIYNFYDGFAKVKKDSLFGFINTNGVEVVKCRYKSAIYFQNGISYIEVDGRKGVVDTLGNEKFNFASNIEDTLVNERDSAGWYLSYKSRNIQRKEYYEQMIPNSFGLFMIKRDGKFGYIDSTLSVVIPVEYEVSYYGDFEYNEHGLLILERDGKKGIVDRHNKVVVPFIFDRINPFENGIARVFKSDKCGIIDTTGRHIF